VVVLFLRGGGGGGMYMYTKKKQEKNARDRKLENAECKFKYIPTQQEQATSNKQLQLPDLSWALLYACNQPRCISRSYHGTMPLAIRATNITPCLAVGDWARISEPRELNRIGGASFLDVLWLVI
jgi:hypothetical protein